MAMNGKQVLIEVETAVRQYLERNSEPVFENMFRDRGGLYIVTTSGTKFRISVSKEE